MPAIETDLTARVRALYEGSAVPVREIAWVAGVTERTLYKYVERYGWKKRYARVPRGEAAAEANRGRRMMPAPGFAPDSAPGFASDFAPDLAPVRGAGGRFIRREEKGQPFAAGLKALDPAAHARGVALSAEAERQAREAEAQAALAYWADEKSSALDALNRALRKVLDLREERKTNPDRLSDEDFDSIEWAMGITAAAAGDALEAVSTEHRRAFEELHGLAAAGHSGTAR